MEYLSQKGVRYTEKNIAKDPGAMEELVKMGAQAVPVILIGDQRLNGFNPSAIDVALADG